MENEFDINKLQDNTPGFAFLKNPSEIKESESTKQIKEMIQSTKEVENKNADKRDELIKNAQSLISRLQTTYGTILSIIDYEGLSSDDKISRIKNIPREFQEIRNYKKTLFEYQRGIDTTQKVLAPEAYSDLAKGTTKDLLNNFSETKLPSNPKELEDKF